MDRSAQSWDSQAEHSTFLLDNARSHVFLDAEGQWICNPSDAAA